MAILLREKCHPVLDFSIFCI